jgi:hypothetical protein
VRRCCRDRWLLGVRFNPLEFQRNSADVEGHLNSDPNRQAAIIGTDPNKEAGVALVKHTVE